jgi:outer membrane receptor protein involved in Fe transport
LGPTAPSFSSTAGGCCRSTATATQDVNLIPSALIESVEVATGGASAVYGSDAIGGVVNFKLRQEFDGVEIGGHWGQTDRGDGEDYDVTLTAGTRFAEGRGLVMGFVGHSDRNQISNSDREFSRAATFYLGPGEGDVGPGGAFIYWGSPATEEGTAYVFTEETSVEQQAEQRAVFDTLFESYGYRAGTVPFPQGVGFNDDGTLFTTGTGDPLSVANFRGEGDPLTSTVYFHDYNFARYVGLQMPLDRTSAFATASFEFSETLEAYGQALYGNYSVRSRIAPVVVNPEVMPPTNPYIPADLKLLLDSRVDPNDVFEFSKRFTAIGPRDYRNDYDTLQATAGLRGQLPRDWSFDAYAQYGASDQEKFVTGNLSRTRLRELTFAEDGGLAACGGFDVFGVDSISQACADYIAADAELVAEVRQFIAEASVRGELFELPAGRLRAAFGIQYRRDEYSLDGNEAFNAVGPDGEADLIGFTGSPDIDADDHNTDLYAEVALPLLSDRPGVETLETVLGYRYSDYASAGGVDAWKAELLYKPVHSVIVRGSYQRAVRVPSIFELYEPRGTSFAFYADPCNVDSDQRQINPAEVEALCVTQGVPVGLLDTFNKFEFPVDFGGNPDLDPEKADTLTAGIVFRSPFESPRLAGLQLSADWYQIEIDDAITGLGTAGSVVNCFDPALNPGLAADNFWCTQFPPRPGQWHDRRCIGCPRQSRCHTDLRRRRRARLEPAARTRQSRHPVADRLDRQLRSARLPGKSAGGVRGHRRRLRRFVPRVEMAGRPALFVAGTGWRRPLAIHRLDARRRARLPL